MKEDLIKVFMKNLELTREQAIELINADENDIETDEMKELSKKSQRSYKRYGKIPRRIRKNPIERKKVDLEKKEL